MANKAISSLAVGSSVYLNVGGTRTEFLVVHQGNPHAGRYDASCDGTWILAKDCPVLRQINASGTNSYASGAVDSYLEGDFYNSFDDVAKSAIKQVKIPYVDSNKSVKTGSNGLSRRVFLLSGPELGMNHTNMLSEEGYRLSYFPSSTVAADKRVSNWNGAPVFYWTRSPDTGSTTNMWAVSEAGALTEAGVTNWKGVRPALILSSDTLIDGNGNVTLPVDLTAHKTLVGGTAYTVKSGKCMVGGTVYNILKGRTLIGGTGYDITFAPPYDPVFANNTWEQIIAACHNNAVPDTWKVADHKLMTISGVDYQIDIIGKNHDDYSDGSGKAPLTFQMHDCYNIAKAMHSTGSNTMGWEKCSMRVEHLPTILKQMPADVQSGIREVNKISKNGGKSTLLVTTKDSLFLLSEVEVFGSSSNSLSGEGTQYDYYKAGNSTVKNFNGSAYDWWERSPSTGSTGYYCVVKSTGSSINANSNTIRGVAFAFCF